MKKLIITSLALALLSSSVVFAAPTATPSLIAPLATATTTAVTPIVSPAINIIKDIPIVATTVKKGLEIKGTMPVLFNTKKADLETTVNTQIKAYYDKQIAKANADGTMMVQFDFKYFKSGNFATIVLYTTDVAASSQSDVTSINFNLQTGSILDLNRILGPNGTKLVNQKISAETKDPKNALTPGNFTGVLPDQSFYVDNDIVTVILENSQMFQANQPFATVNVPLSDVTDVIVSTDKVKTIDGVKLIPLKETATALGFNVTWDGTKKLVNVSGKGLDNTISQNSAKVTTPVGQRELSSPITIINGTTYVPLSYFEVVLNSTYEVENTGNITVSTLK